MGKRTVRLVAWNWTLSCVFEFDEHDLKVLQLLGCCTTAC